MLVYLVSPHLNHRKNSYTVVKIVDLNFINIRE